MGHLQESLALLDHVGPVRLSALHDLGIKTIEDLLFYFPFRYDMIVEKDPNELLDGDKVVLKGLRINQATVNFYGRKKSRLQVQIMVLNHVIRLIFFNQHYLKDKINQLDEIAIYGKWDASRQQLIALKLLGGFKEGQGQSFEAVYPASQAIKAGTIRQLVEQAFERFGEEISDLYPLEALGPYGYMSRRQAVYNMHFPKREEDYQKAHEQLTCEEFLSYQLRLQDLKLSRQKGKNDGYKIRYDLKQLKKAIQEIPFELTQGQKQVVNLICRDFLQAYPMNRLLQGDVGSGKTVVAFLAMIAVGTSGGQVALMAPTEILAQQHYERFKKMFPDLAEDTCFLSGSTSKKDRQAILEALANGQALFAFGTHALFQDSVHFKGLTCAIIDEEHRFGVKQKEALCAKGDWVNVMYMTATPIPRTLTVTLYGDMDVSLLKEKPMHRQGIKTFWIKESQLVNVYQECLRRVRAGQQVYFVSSLIEESEELDLKSALELFKQLKKHFPTEVRLGLLHGRMTPDEKEEVMDAFQTGHLDILVATTVIEVGVDVPNATLMVILDADRFGLSQLHQLRGRVGRGATASSCILVADPKTEEGKERLRLMTESQDGFYLSEADWRLRGPGSVFGVKQSGLPEFRVGDLYRDQEIMFYARQIAHQMVTEKEGENYENCH
ncbi:ATP-dependent DNA helicase RecG [Atopobacter sp. AH10]|uniref:ATP-dependent DNA helicase RecG n=1 Tax=Atopobacter sp. AH10 TaxID=2315861 RepID=UPI000EF1D062|nr:ATP-dependent DNA helicase RecG [Atopobacter sp. AH10]RLK63294.1 ATP-dependent DNA helicase RecG [Atopobacter sp. AH10]